MKNSIMYLTIFTLSFYFIYYGSAKANTIISIYGDQDGFGIGFQQDQHFSDDYPILKKDDPEDTDTITDEWLKGDQIWSHTYDVSNIEISRAYFEIFTLGQGWHGISELYIDDLYIGDLTDGDNSGAYLNTNWARLDVFDISEYVSLLKGANTITINTYGINDDKWALDYSKITISDQLTNCPTTYDVNGDGKTGLEEAIYALQVVSGIINSISTHDVNGDGKTGLEEAIYALQVVSGVK